MEVGLAKSFWGLKDCEWSAVGSEGRSGGLLTIWSKGTIEPIFSFKDKGILGVNADWKGTNCYFVNIYSSCCIAEKRVLWNRLLEWKQHFLVGEWIIGGDFNAIKKGEERRGKVQSSRVEMEEFSKFIELMEVVDLPMLGNKFTWLNSNGRARSRIDRILLSEGIIKLWNAVAQVTGKRDVSNHRPVWVKSSNVDWGPKPFKVFKCWFEHGDFLKFVKTEWNSHNEDGTSAFVLKEKLKRLRERLRWWNRNVFGWVDMKFDEDVEEINVLEDDDIVVTTQLSKEMEERSRKLQESIWRNLNHKESILKQKSRMKWVKEGYNNSKYFHSVVKARTRRNSIVSIRTEQGVIEEVEEVKRGVKDHFEKRFRKSVNPRPSLTGVEFNKLSEAERLQLDEEFTREEIKEVVFSCDGDKSPGPDGFNIDFIKRMLGICG
ncbi:uncharacterized protein LOC131630577 [Vicia villosa]|uniref:uncharacterized protein LOC131630577 n=1 Tax=Vicia villosa TaxID=3911 RepID=UPI00273B1240|nr:uncharacterized protein LOC131630577 [Vicia villosa]